MPVSVWSGGQAPAGMPEPASVQVKWTTTLPLYQPFAFGAVVGAAVIVGGVASILKLALASAALDVVVAVLARRVDRVRPVGGDVVSEQPAAGRPRSRRRRTPDRARSGSGRRRRRRRCRWRATETPTGVRYQPFEPFGEAGLSAIVVVGRRRVGDAADAEGVELVVAAALGRLRVARAPVDRAVDDGRRRVDRASRRELPEDAPGRRVERIHLVARTSPSTPCSRRRSRP